MIRNYFTLYALAHEMASLFEGGFIFEMFSQEKSELRVSIFTKEKKQLSLVGLTGQTQLSLYYTEDAQRRRRNSAALMTAANDKQILSVRISDNDRIITLGLEDKLELVLQLFSADTNFFLIREGIIIEAFKKNSELAATAYLEKPAKSVLRSLEELVSDKPKFEALFAPLSPEFWQKHIPSLLPGFDAVLAREALYRSRSGLTVAALHEAVSDLFYELISPEPKIGFAAKGDSIWFSIINEAHRGAPERTESFGTINDALRTYSFKQHQAEHFGKELRGLKKQLARLAEKTTAQIKALEDQSTKNRAERYERIGHQLMQHLHLIQKGMTAFEVMNDEEPYHSQIIGLEALKTPYQNAELYFDKAKKSRESERQSRKRLEEIQKKLIEIDQLQLTIERVTESKAFQLWRQKNAPLLLKFLLVSKEEAEKQQLFKRFQISKDAELWVGKNAKNNDVLTFKYARPNDLWFHARGVSGSHCVLKINRPPSKEELERAASIAAYYSSAKTSEYAPVIYTPKKFVRKPKGALPGSVKVEREEVILVKPQLEADEEE
jgi:predicted ribosome quality control (RQC) complex YloA/Tae2 family protein